jgi:ATP-dependent DNA ligase
MLADEVEQVISTVAAPFRAACDMGLEGLVSKRANRPYRGGRSPHLLKVKNRAHHAFDRVAIAKGRR